MPTGRLFRLCRRGPNSVGLRKTHKYPRINDLRHSPDTQRAFFNGFSAVFQQYSWELHTRLAPAAPGPVHNRASTRARTTTACRTVAVAAPSRRAASLMLTLSVRGGVASSSSALRHHNWSEFGFTPTQNYSYRSGAHHPGVGTIVILLSSAAPAVARRTPAKTALSECRDILPV